MTLFSRILRTPSALGDVKTMELLSRPGCHLCDEAMTALRRELANVQIDVIDINQHPDLEAEFVFRIPVVLYQGDVLAEGIIDRREARLVKRELKRRARLDREAE